jgi:hypothetical protein
MKRVVVSQYPADVLRLLPIGVVTLAVAAACTIKTTDNGSGGQGGMGAAGSGGVSTGNGGSGGVQSSGGMPGTGDTNAAGGLAGQSENAGAAGEYEPGEGGASVGGSGEAGTGAEGGESAGGSPGGGCIASISGLYVVRTDGVAIKEGPPEKVVVDGTSGTDNAPLTGVVDVQEETSAACALVKGGEVQCWQEDANKGNSSGQLGNGTTTPVSVFRSSVVLTAADKPLEKVVSLAASINSNTACAVTSDGRLWCWGDLSWIASNGSLVSPYAQLITTDGQSELTNVLQAAVGSDHACALIKGSPNTVSCWGTAASEELGQGNTTNHQYPVNVPGLDHPTKVLLTYANNNYGCGRCGAEEEGVCAIDGGTVQCWGANDAGALGSSSGVGVVPAPTPVITSTMATLRDVIDLQEGTNGFAVLRSDHTIWRWGYPQGNTAYADSFGVPNVVQLGWPGDSHASIRYLTSDGVYHNGMTELSVNCGAFE